jgi:hypothetical protein
MMDGYIIVSENGQILTQGLWWFPHERLEDCHVFPPHILRIVNRPVPVYDNKMHKEWTIKAKYAYPARYTLDEGVVVTGEKFALEQPPGAGE